MKVYFRRAAIMLAMLITSVVTWADESGSCGDGVTYYYEEATHTLTISKTGEGTGAITGVSCNHYDEIETVIIEDGVTRIMDYAFYGLRALVTVSISNTVTRIDDKAFEYCYNLANLTIGSGVTYIGCETFACASLTTLDIPASVRAIGFDAFGGCESLTDLTLHEGLQTIGWDAFYGCKSLADIKIPNSVTDIGGQAFWDTAWFNAQPDGMVCQDDWLIGFKGDDQPLTIPLPDKTFTKIAGRAFCYAKNDGDGSYLTTHDIVSVTIPSCVTTISRGAFQGCRADNVYCFADPATLTWDTRNRRLITSDDALWGLAYQECENFKTYGTTTKFHVADASAWSAKFPDANATFVGDLSTALGGNCGAAGHAEDVTWSYDLYTRTLTVSGSGAMADYSRPDGENSNAPWYDLLHGEIETVSMGSGVTQIGNYAFYGCTALRNVGFGGVTTIGSNAFRACTALAAVNFSGVETIGEHAFWNCTGLTSINLSGVVTINTAAFDDCTGLTALEIPASVRTVGGFSGCTGLTAVKFSEGVTTFGNSAFMGCTGLTGSLVLPSTTTTINLQAFKQCSGLTTVTIPAGVTSIGSGVFNGCTGVTDVYCYANPSTLTWSNNTYLFKGDSKETRCHVYNADAWSSFPEKVTGSLTFVGDLDTYIFYADNWDYVATSVANSDTPPYTTSGKTYKLCNDITVSSMIGTADYPFSGTFDGQGNTLTLDINTAEGAAPFRNISGATIQNLKVDGTLNAGNHSAALVGVVRGGTNVIENCVVSADITLSAYGGGIVAHGTSATTTLQGCVFDGTITGGTEVGTLWGWSDAAKVTITDCLDLSATTHPIGRCRTDAGYSISVGNTYYTNPEKSTSGEYPWTGANGGTRAGAYTTKPDAIGAAGTDYGYVTAYASGLGYDGKYYMVPTAISLADNASNSTTISNANGHAANVTLTGRTLWKDGAWNTLCLPFDVSTASAPLSGDGVTAMVLDAANSGVSGSTLTLNFTSATSIPAGTPFIIKWNNTGTTIEDPEFTGVTISNATANNAQAFTGGSFTGSYSPVSFTANDKSILFLGAENNLYWPNADMTLGACRAHFELSEGSGAREIKLNFGEENTSIHNSQCTMHNESGAWYDMQGRKLSQKPTKAGLYIHNGRKVMVK